MAFINRHINLDKLGMTASLLCAIHCLALPLLISAGLIGGLNWFNHGFTEWSLIILALLIAGKSFLHSYWNQHHSILPYW